MPTLPSADERQSHATPTNVADLEDLLSNKLAHLSAVLKPTFGECGHVFRMHSAEIQDNYAWACSTLADECRELFERITGG